MNKYSDRQNTSVCKKLALLGVGGQVKHWVLSTEVY